MCRLLVRHECGTPSVHCPPTHVEQAAALLPAVVETLKDEDVGVALAAVSSLVAAASALQVRVRTATTTHISASIVWRFVSPVPTLYLLAMASHSERDLKLLHSMSSKRLRPLLQPSARV